MPIDQIFVPILLPRRGNVSFCQPQPSWKQFNFDVAMFPLGKEVRSTVVLACPNRILSSQPAKKGQYHHQPRTTVVFCDRCAIST